MADDSFNVVFRGDIVPGQSLPDVKARFAQLFKLDVAKVEAYFTGKPVVLKKDCDRATAEKFKAVLAQAGALVDIKAAVVDSAQVPAPRPAAPPAAAMPVATPAPAPATAAPAAAAGAPVDAWSLSPRGSDLIRSEEIASAAPVQVSIDHISVAKRNPFAQDAEPPLEAERSVTAPPLDLSGYQLGQVGEPLAEEQPFVALELDLSALSLDAPGGALLHEDEMLPVMAVAVETGHLSLAPPGGELGEIAPPPPPPPPSTDHLYVQK